MSDLDWVILQKRKELKLRQSDTRLLIEDAAFKAFAASEVAYLGAEIKELELHRDTGQPPNLPTCLHASSKCAMFHTDSPGRTCHLKPHRCGWDFPGQAAELRKEEGDGDAENLPR